MEASSPNVPAFLTKLWKLVDDVHFDDLICWGQNGKSFIIRNQSLFAKELLPLYFKHNNMASFIRQLNMYGFRKITNIEQTGLRTERDDVEFYHQHFVRGKENELEFIKRKISNNKQSVALIDKTKQEEVKDMITDIQTMRGRQDSVDSMLTTLQKENESLWREVAILRQKHHKQQQIVEKLIQFLVTLVHNRGVAMGGIKRKSQLMINGIEDDQSTEGYKMRKKSHSGPIINEIDDILDEELLNRTSPVITTNLGELSPLQAVISAPEDSQEPVPDLLSTLNTSQLGILDPLQSSIVNAEIVVPDINSQSLDFDTLKTPEILLNTSDVSPINTVNKQSQGTSKNPVTDIVISGTSDNDTLSLSPTTVTNALNDHVDGIETELDWLQEQLTSGGLNLDSSTLLGLFSMDDSNPLSNFWPNKGNEIIGNELVQFQTPNFQVPDEFDLDDLASIDDESGCLSTESSQINDLLN